MVGESAGYGSPRGRPKWRAASAGGSALVGMVAKETLMRLQSPYEDVGAFDAALVPRSAAKAEAQVRPFEPRLLEITVGGLLVLWWLQVFGLWTRFLTWAASLGVSTSF